MSGNIFNGRTRRASVSGFLGISSDPCHSAALKPGRLQLWAAGKIRRGQEGGLIATDFSFVNGASYNHPVTITGTFLIHFWRLFTVYYRSADPAGKIPFCR